MGNDGNYLPKNFKLLGYSTVVSKLIEDKPTLRYYKENSNSKK